MKAIVIDQYGDREELKEREIKNLNQKLMRY